jgi:hypothetical protein
MLLEEGQDWYFCLLHVLENCNDVLLMFYSFGLFIKDIIILEWGVLCMELFRFLCYVWFFCFSAFVKSDRPAKFPNLQIKYVRGLDPIIKLMDKDGNVQDVSVVSSMHTVVHVVFMFML